jgi:hypothetical protein
MPLQTINTKIAKQTVKIGLKIDFRGKEDKCHFSGIVEINGMGR